MVECFPDLFGGHLLNTGQVRATQPQRGEAFGAERVEV